MTAHTDGRGAVVIGAGASGLTTALVLEGSRPATSWVATRHLRRLEARIDPRKRPDPGPTGGAGTDDSSNGGN